MVRYLPPDMPATLIVYGAKPGDTILVENDPFRVYLNGALLAPDQYRITMDEMQGAEIATFPLGPTRITDE